MFSTVLYILFIAFFIYCAFSVTYLFILSFSGKFFYRQKKSRPLTNGDARTIAVLVPAYREDGIILSTVHNLLGLDYPKHLYEVFVIADSFEKETLLKLQQLPVKVFEVSFEKSTKTKALNEAFKRIEQPFDVALICDADNMLAKDFLKKINASFSEGFKAVQGRRVAKNLDSSFAILDACSEAINNHIFRKGLNGLGLSTSVIGSGMAFDFIMIKNILGAIQAVGGFDKILQLKVIRMGFHISYLDDALIFDEKVGNAAAFQQQRKRWVSSQFIYLKQYFLPAFRELFKGNLSYFNLAVVSNLILPRAFMLIMLPLLVVAALFISAAWAWIAAGLWLLYFITLFIALPSVLINRDLLSAILRLPKAITVMVGTLFQIKKANKTFIHTVHTKTEIKNTLFNEQGK
jgi:cellulose synthase/poly-beta-1,6-N-acetylglucosamine synthase-like glycosyltransferase